MLYVSKSYTKQATAMPRTNFLEQKQEWCFLEHNKNNPFLEIGMKQEQCVLEHNKNDPLWKLEWNKNDPFWKW